MTQVFTADGLRKADPRNRECCPRRVFTARGQITAGGQLLAYSVATDGRFLFRGSIPILRCTRRLPASTLLIPAPPLERAGEGPDIIERVRPPSVWSAGWPTFFTGRDDHDQPAH